MIKTIDIYKLWVTTLATLNTQQGGHLRPRTFIDWVNEISREMFNERREQWEKSQVIDDELAVSFLETVNIVLAANPGQNFDSFVYPERYAYFSSARFLMSPDEQATLPLAGAKDCDCKTGKCSPSTFMDEDDIAQAKQSPADSYVERNVQKVDNSRWGSALGHRLKGPTRKRPMITQYKTGFHVAPRGMGVLVLDYLIAPRDAVFSYTLQDDIIIYDATTSIQLEWTEMVMGEFVARLKKRYGSLTRDQELYQQGAQESAKG